MLAEKYERRRPAYARLCLPSERAMPEDFGGKSEDWRVMTGWRRCGAATAFCLAARQALPLAGWLLHSRHDAVKKVSVIPPP